MEQTVPIFICPYCGHLTKMIWVHGHGQCAVCGVTIDECCRGEHAEREVPETEQDQKQKTIHKPKQDDDDTKKP